jgi:hypothetical protein
MIDAAVSRDISEPDWARHGRALPFRQAPQTTDVILRYVPFLEIEKYLRNGWMVVVPPISHPALDATAC